MFTKKRIEINLNKNAKFSIYFATIIIFGILVRFIFINKLPPALHFDEARNGLDAVKILSGEIKNLIKQPVLLGDKDPSKEALYNNILAFSIKTFGQNETSLRITSAILSSISLVMFLFLSKKIFRGDKKSQVIAITFYAFSSWNIIASRLVYRLNLIPLVTIGALFPLLAILKSKKPSTLNYVLFGAINAIGIYTYSSYLVLFLFLYTTIFVFKLHKKVFYSILA